MELDLHKLIKKALSHAREAYEKKDYDRAASSYEKAANWMSMYAEQATGREAEQRRKKKAVEYRETAKKLRSREFGTDDGRPDGEEKKASSDGAEAGAPIRAIVSNLMHHSAVTWDDIGGLEETKAEIKFALGMSLAQQPDGMKITPWHKMLFYGPPGTGKTLLAAATSNALRSTEGTPAVFFNVKVSSVLSKYFGESSKIISELYGTARDTSPSVVFLDEFESIAARRDGSDSGAERRILSTLLSELDGMDEKGRQDIYVLSIAATNRPWDLDAAVLSRFEKKILIPLPDPESREAILRIHLERRGYSVEPPYSRLVEMSEGYSGREIERFCKEVTTGMIEEMNRDIPGLVDKGLDNVKKYRIQVRPLTAEDFDRASRLIHPQTTPEQMQKYVDWKEAAEET